MPDISARGLRPVWIASYPRSGNTFLRIMLENIFRLPSHSIYRIEGQNHTDPSADALEEAPFLPRNWRQLLSNAPDAQLTLIKTHGPPESEPPCIYIVRDGRQAVHSYFHYHKKFAFEQPSLTEVIAGACQFGSWSEHVLAWRPQSRPHTLFLRYEDLVARPAEVIPKLAQFLQVEPSGGRLPTFAELQQRVPAFFRRGQNQDFLVEWTPSQLALFNYLHGPVMKELGYTLIPATQSAEAAGIELAASAARLHRLYLEQLTRSGLLSEDCRRKAEEISQLKEQIQSLSEGLARQSKAMEPLTKNSWVRFGMAVGVVADVRTNNGH